MSAPNDVWTADFKGQFRLRDRRYWHFWEQRFLERFLARPSGRFLRTLGRRFMTDIVHSHFSAAIFTTALARRKTWPATLGTFHGLSFPLVNGLKGRLLRVAQLRALLTLRLL